MSGIPNGMKWVKVLGKPYKRKITWFNPLTFQTETKVKTECLNYYRLEVK
jgi:hypothetical protein